MTYTVISSHGETSYRNIREATIAYARLVTNRREAVILGPDRLDGTREQIATYYPPPEVASDGLDRKAPGRGSAMAYWYAIGWIDSTPESGWLRDTHATRFATMSSGIDPSMLRGRWVEFLEDNAPSDE